VDVADFACHVEDHIGRPQRPAKVAPIADIFNNQTDIARDRRKIVPVCAAAWHFRVDYGHTGAGTRQAHCKAAADEPKASSNHYVEVLVFRSQTI
jgi:hypothetical protein